MKKVLIRQRLHGITDVSGRDLVQKPVSSKMSRHTFGTWRPLDPADN